MVFRSVVMMWFALFGLCGCGTGQEDVSAPEPSAPVVSSVVTPAIDCESPPPSECCRGITPDCNKCRATYAAFLKACPGVKDAQVRMPVMNQPPKQGNSSTSPLGLPDFEDSKGVHFKDGVQLTETQWLSCDELEKKLCCTSNSEQCRSCRENAKGMIEGCRNNSADGRILVSPSGYRGTELDKDGNPKARKKLEGSVIETPRVD